MEVTIKKVFRRKKGQQKGKWIARVLYQDPLTGKTITREKSADRQNEAKDIQNRMRNEIARTHGGIKNGEKMTFEQLSNICEELFYQPAVISPIEGKKIEGVRSYKTAQNYLKILREYFGKRRIITLSLQDLKEYRKWRLKIGSRRPEIVRSGKFANISLSTINRELSAMRRMMGHALTEGWVMKDIFRGSGMISKSDERSRERMLSIDEEQRLLRACSGERSITYQRTVNGKTSTHTAVSPRYNPHLKALILLALDAGMRRGEILRLRWSDIDFDARLIHVIAQHTKTEEARRVPLTDRVKIELNRIRQFTHGDDLFPFKDFKRSWGTAKRIAGIEDLHFHDLRRTALTRWQNDYGQGLSFAGKVAGHRNYQTTYRHYSGVADREIRSLADVMDAAHRQLELNDPLS